MAQQEIPTNNQTATHMHAVVWTKYGPPEVLQFREVPKPTPKANEVLIRIHASTVTAGDSEARQFMFHWLFWPLFRLVFGIFKPRFPILGQEYAGTIVEVGKEVSQFSIGQQVFGPTKINFGAHAEYICLPTDHLIGNIPSNMSFEEAATISTGGLNAFHFIQKADLKPGDHILINGAGGCIGTYAIQLAKYHQATVTAVDREDKLDMLRSLGANHVIDYQLTDFTELNTQYNVILDVVGACSILTARRSLKPGGTFLLANPLPGKSLLGMFLNLFSKKKVFPTLAPYAKENLNQLIDFIEAGHLTSVIDKQFPLSEAIEAHRYVDSGAKKGNVVLNISS